MNTNYFKNRGYDIQNDKSLQRYYISKIPVEVIDSIENEIFSENRDKVIKLAASYGVKLRDNQLYALTDIAYQYGIGGGGIENIIASLRAGRTVSQGTASGFYNNGNRGNRRWILFSTGKYLDDNGKEL